MKDFNSLTQQGKMRRYHKMAHFALQSYPLVIKQIRCLTIRHNIIFRVDALEGTYILRIGYPKMRSALMVESEMRWLDDMRNNVDLNLSFPLRTKDNQLLVTCKVDGIPEKRYVVVLKWLNGSTIETAPTSKKLSAMGSALAKLHTFAKDYHPTSPFMAYDNFRCDEWGGLSYLDADNQLISAEQKAVFKEAINLSEDAVTKWRKHDGLSLIHADFHLKNVNWYRGKVGVFDFDDCRWGHFVQDWGVILTWIQDKPTLHEAFVNGYQSQRLIPFSERDFTLARIHRIMVGLTFVINYRPHNAETATNDTYVQLKLLLRDM